jgi:hypothetical protein
MDSDEFDWSLEDTTIGEQHQIACYLNNAGNLVIRERAGCCDDGDTWIVVAKNNVELLIRMLGAVGGIDLRPSANIALLPKPANTAGAERSRRYRQRHAVTPSASRETDERHGERDAERHASQPLLLVAAE